MEMCRGWLFTPHYDLALVLAIVLRRSETCLGGAIGDPRDAMCFCIVLHDFRFDRRYNQTFRAH
jgi:hypothetical protein